MATCLLFALFLFLHDLSCYLSDLCLAFLHTAMQVCLTSPDGCCLSVYTESRHFMDIYSLLGNGHIYDKPGTLHLGSLRFSWGCQVGQ